MHREGGQDVICGAEPEAAQHYTHLSLVVTTIAQQYITAGCMESGRVLYRQQHQSNLIKQI